MAKGNASKNAGDAASSGAGKKGSNATSTAAPANGNAGGGGAVVSGGQQQQQNSASKSEGLSTTEQLRRQLEQQRIYVPVAMNADDAVVSAISAVVVSIAGATGFDLPSAPRRHQSENNNHDGQQHHHHHHRGRAAGAGAGDRAPRVQPSKDVPCRFFFGPQRGNCKLGDNCGWSHEEQVFLDAYGLHRCPTEGCENACRGRVCRFCHERIVQRIQEKRALAKAAGRNDGDGDAGSGAGADADANVDGENLRSTRDDGGRSGQDQNRIRRRRQPANSADGPAAVDGNGHGGRGDHGRRRLPHPPPRTQNRRADYHDRPLKKCDGMGCTRMSSSRLCHGCAEVERQYVVPSVARFH